MKRIIVFIYLSIGISANAFASPSLDRQIQSLIESIGESECSFVRNGKSHSAEASMQHLNRKYSHFKDDIDSVARFVELAASKSMITGRAYEVQCAGESQPSSEWLLKQAVQLGLNS